MIDSPTSQEKPLALVVDDDLSLRFSMEAALVKAGTQAGKSPANISMQGCDSRA